MKTIRFAWRDYAVSVIVAIALAVAMVLAIDLCFGTVDEQERRRIEEIRSICADLLDAGASHD